MRLDSDADRPVRRLGPALCRYLGASGAGNLLWESGQLPLYAIWRTGSWSENAFAILHCTGGDLLIAAATLVGALIVLGARDWPRAGAGSVAAVTIAAGLGYTGYSEWLNVYERQSWAYDPAMPTIDVAGYAIGLSPLGQWIVVPAVALAFASRLPAR